MRERPDGTRETLATHWGHKELNSPNDVIVSRDGSIIFTDPTYGRMPGFGIEREQDLDFHRVSRLPAVAASRPPLLFVLPLPTAPPLPPRRRPSPAARGGGG